MNPRIKKIFGALFIGAFVVFWVVLSVSLSGFVPDNFIAELMFYVIMGLGWVFPLFPILKWMEKDKPKPPA